MPGPVSDAGAPPSVPLSFSNNFWGREDAGVQPLLERMQNAKTTCDELTAFYHARAALEQDYANKLLSLCRKPLGSGETGTLRASLDVVRGEVEAMGKQHALIAGQMKSELEEPLVAFAGGMKERRKIVQTGIERLFKTKQTQTKQANQCRDKYEQDCLRIKGYLAQGHMVMGQEERKNKAKLEKTQINMATDSNEYEAAIRVLEETTGRWNKDWKAACDKFQDLEEERIDFTKSSLWSFANIASTVCVSDDASCEKMRLSLENCEVEKDILGFIKMRGTGQEIPDPPKYINFARGDVGDTASEASADDDTYSVAQFQRTIKPEYRSTSPNPSTYESHHEPQSELAQRMNGGPVTGDTDDEPTPSKANSGRPAPLNYKQPDPSVPPNYSPSQHGDLTQVPHNEYPTDGMTMFCRTSAPSVTSSALSSNTRPSSRDDQSEYSNPTSYTSADPMSRNASPTKGRPPVNGVEMPGMASPDKSVQKKRSAFFSNSPFRRKSKKDLNHEPHTPSSNRNTWAPSSTSAPASRQSSPTKHPSSTRPLYPRAPPDGEEPADPRATFQLNVGANVFDVASPDSQSTPKALQNGPPQGRSVGFPIPPLADDDPIAQALADLKAGGTGMNKQASMRVTADRYHGIQTPAPSADGRPARPAGNEMLAKTPPPAYDASVVSGNGGISTPAMGPALGVPPPAFTSSEMRKRTVEWGGGGSAYGGGQSSSRDSRQIPMHRPGSSAGHHMRSRSPGPGVPRAASPQPMSMPMRARSPGPGLMHSQQQQQQQQMRARSPGPSMTGPGNGAQFRASSPSPYPVIGGGGQRLRGGGSRQNSGMEMQLSSQEVQRHDGYDGGGSGSGRSREGMMDSGRPKSAYGGDLYGGSQSGGGRGPGGGVGGRGLSIDPGMRRQRSKSMAAPMQPSLQQNGQGRGPLHYARALYSYTAAIPEELSFAKGDILAVLRLQDDGWWEAEVSKGRGAGSGPGGRGLVPSNYLARC